MKIGRLQENSAKIVDKFYKKYKKSLKSIPYSVDHFVFQARTNEEFQEWKEIHLKKGRIIETQEMEGAEILSFELTEPYHTKCGMIRMAVLRQPAGNKVYSEYGLVSTGFYVEGSYDEFLKIIKGEDLEVIEEKESDNFVAISYEDTRIEFMSRSRYKDTVSRNLPTSDQEKIQTLNEEIQRLKEINFSLEKEKAAKLQIMADFQNYRKRMDKEKSNFGLVANLEIVNDVMDSLDDIKRALDDEEEDGNDSRSRQMLEIVRDKLLATIDKVGVEQIDVSDGEVFDTKLMEAVGVVSVKDVDMHNKVIKVVQPAYKYKTKDQLLRTARVIVGKKDTKK